MFHLSIELQFEILSNCDRGNVSINLFKNILFLNIWKEKNIKTSIFHSFSDIGKLNDEYIYEKILINTTIIY